MGWTGVGWDEMEKYGMGQDGRGGAGWGGMGRARASRTGMGGIGWDDDRIWDETERDGMTQDGYEQEGAGQGWFFKNPRQRMYSWYLIKKMRFADRP